MGTDFKLTGRIVQGNPYGVTQKLDDNGKPRFKADGSTPLMSSFVALAVPKTDPNWPAMRAFFDAEAQRAWPTLYTHRDFANKIEDGDSTEINKKGKRNCEREGFPGHWIVKLGSGFAAKVVVWLTAAQAAEQGRVPPGKQAIDDWYESAGGEVKCGDIVTVAGSIETNNSQQSPGMYMNLHAIALEQVGAAIVTGIDATAVFGTRGPGAAPTPNFAPAASPPPPAATTPPSTTASAPPYDGYMGAGAAPPPPPAHVMLPAANGLSYESYIQSGWTHEQMISNGIVQA